MRGSECGDVHPLAIPSYCKKPCVVGRYPDSRTNCTEMVSPESLATEKRTASQLRSFGKRGQAFAYPKLQDSRSASPGIACSCPGAEQWPRQLAPKGNRAGCGKAMSSALCVGAKKGQAKIGSSLRILLTENRDGHQDRRFSKGILNATGKHVAFRRLRTRSEALLFGQESH